MVGEARIRTVEYHEILVPLGSHGNEIATALSVANEASKRTRHLGSSDVYVTADDDNIIIGYQRDKKEIKAATTEDYPEEMGT